MEIMELTKCVPFSQRPVVRAGGWGAAVMADGEEDKELFLARETKKKEILSALNYYQPCELNEQWNIVHPVDKPKKFPVQPIFNKK